MMNWVGIGLLVPLLMCAAMMIGGAGLAVLGFRRVDRTARERDWFGEPSEPVRDRS